MRFDYPNTGMRYVYTHSKKTLDELFEDSTTQKFMLETGPPALVIKCPKCDFFFVFKAFNMTYPNEATILCYDCQYIGAPWYRTVMETAITV